MIRSWEPLYEVCQIVAAQEQLRATVGAAAEGAVITAAGAFVGALLGGSRGLAIGGALASAATAMYTEGNYKSVVDILRNDLTRDQKRKLANSLSRLVDVGSGDVMTIVTLISAQESLKKAVITEIGNFLSTELNMRMVSN